MLAYMTSVLRVDRERAEGEEHEQGRRIAYTYEDVHGENQFFLVLFTYSTKEKKRWMHRGLACSGHTDESTWIQMLAGFT